jgi:sigma-B regulation protein RsbU (phosphoserine phosphatase)
MDKKKFSRNNLAFNIVSAVLLLIVIFSIIVSLIGSNILTENVNRSYGDAAYAVADMGLTMVNGNHIDRYLKTGESDEEWQETTRQLQTLCDRMQATMIYVICLDTADYESYTTVFHVVGSDIDDYKPLSVGQVKTYSNDSFKREFKELYKDDNIASFTLIGATELHGDKAYITSVHPVRDDSGKITAVLCAQVPVTDMHTRVKYFARIAVAAIVLAALVIIAYTKYIRKNIAGPIGQVSAETKRFAAENTKGEGLDIVSRINEISSLSHSVDEMEEEMLEYIENLTAVTAERERVSTELSVAKRIQENAVPHTFPAFPERKDFDLYAFMQPAKEVGGDFYNYFLIDDDHLALVMADVSDKGIPAALFMMVTNILISDRTRLGGTPAEIIEYVNDTVCSNNEAGMFVTVWLGILELSTGKITACNAGHDDPAVYRKGGTFELVKTVHDIAVGAMGGLPYSDYEIQLNKGDKLFLYTDGVPEATDRDMKMLSLGTMVDTLNRHKEETPQKILEGIYRGINEFVADAPQFDDITMLCLELKEDEVRNGGTPAEEAP